LVRACVPGLELRKENVMSGTQSGAGGIGRQAGGDARTTGGGEFGGGGGFGGLLPVLQDQRAVAKELAIANKGVNITELPDIDPRTGYWASRAGEDGSLVHELVLCPAGPRDHAADDLAALIDLADDECVGFKGADDKVLKPVASIWVSAHKVRLVFDHRGRREEHATLSLFEGEAFRVVRKLVHGEAVAGVDDPQAVSVFWRSNKKLIDLIRVALNARSEGPVRIEPFGVLVGLRRMKVYGSSSAVSDVGGGRESQSREVTNEALGWDEAWEELTLTLPVYDNLRLVDGAPSLSVGVKLDLSVDAGTGNLRLRPKAGELSRAVDAAMLEVVESLRGALNARGLGKLVAVYRGSEEF